MSTLNVGILAHVDAGKTSLTERLLYTAGVIDEIGSVDSGSTQTDTLALERARGITIRSAVASFAAGGGNGQDTVNLIDTPGHPDFIAEVERVLGVLDGVVLVVSAVEGVQAQTRVLTRALRRLRIPTLIFVNKIDRRGARVDSLLTELTTTLSAVVVPMGTVRSAGTPGADYVPYRPTDPVFATGLAEQLAEYDDDLLAAVVAGQSVPSGQLMAALAAQTAAVAVHPVFFGSAITGAGVDALVEGVRALLPAAGGDPAAPVSGTVFSVQRGPAGEKIAYARLFAGTVRTRERLRFGDGRAAKVTAVEVVGAGTALTAGRIGRLWGLAEVRVGDPIGTAPRAGGRQFAPPTLETVVEPDLPGDRGRLYAALAQLAEQDPLINVRQDDARKEVSVSLYGEVQKEVIQATLATDFGVPVGFRETTTLCVERPVGTGSAVANKGAPGNPFKAGLGLRVEPAPAGSGVGFGLGIERGSLTAAFITAVEQTVRWTLREGLSGWLVTDCVVTLIHSEYTPPPPGGWSVVSTSAADFRHLTPLVLAGALTEAGTRVYEPVHRFTLEIPADTVGVVQPLLGRLGGPARTVTPRGREYVLEGDIPAARVHELELALPALTRGEAVLDAAFDHYEPTRGRPPTRPRTDHNPFHRKEYLLNLQRHG